MSKKIVLFPAVSNKPSEIQIPKTVMIRRSRCTGHLNWPRVAFYWMEVSYPGLTCASKLTKIGPKQL